MRNGKLTDSELRECLDIIANRNPDNVLVKSAAGEDCAVLNCGGDILVTTDPITARCAHSGRLAVDISANDIYSDGGVPFACTLTIVAPEGTALSEIKEIIADAEGAASRLGLTIVGGHTERSASVSVPIVSVTMLGKACAPVLTSGARGGDAIVMSKYAALEGCAILAENYGAALGLSEDEILEAVSAELSVKIESEIGVKYGAHAMHDITEGGVYGAVTEMAQASGLRADIYRDDIPVKPVTEKICRGLGLNVYALISSGSMLFSVSDGSALVRALEDAGVNAAVIGRFSEGEGAYSHHGGVCERIGIEKDELFNVNKR